MKKKMLKLLPKKVRNFLLWLRNVLFDFAYWPQSKNEFIQLNAEVSTIDEAVDLLWKYHGKGFYRNLKPNQDRGEIIQLGQRVTALKPKVIVEIGTRDGGSLYLWRKCVETADLVVSIDLPHGIHGGGYHPKRAKLFNLFSGRPQAQLELLQLDSQTEATRDKLLEILQGRKIDFLFIDGDHRYEGVKKDYELYAPLVQIGGLIAFHDIWANTFDSSIQVNQLWDEIKQSELHTEEIVHQPYSGHYGIGLITISNE